MKGSSRFTNMSLYDVSRLSNDSLAGLWDAANWTNLVERSGALFYEQRAF